MTNRYTHTLKWLNERHDIGADKIVELERKVSHLQKEVDELRSTKADRRGPKPKTPFMDKSKNRIEHNPH